MELLLHNHRPFEITGGSAQVPSRTTDFDVEDCSARLVVVVDDEDVVVDGMVVVLDVVTTSSFFSLSIMQFYLIFANPGKLSQFFPKFQFFGA